MRVALAMSLAAVVPCAASAQSATVVATASDATTPSEAVIRAIRDSVGGKFKNFYRQRGYWPLWLRGNAPGPQAKTLIDLIETSTADGLDPDRYDAVRLRGVIADAAGGDPEALAYAEVALSSAFADLVRDMRRTRIEIRYLDPALAPGRDRPEEVLRRAALAPSLADYVRRIGWMNPLYVDLRTALLESGDARDAPGIIIPAGALLREGSVDARVLLLRRRFGLDDDGGFDAALAARVRGFQASHGLPADGIVGAQTIAALNMGGAAIDRRAVLRLNMERARVLPSPWTRHVVVDAAAARLWYFGEGSEQGTMRVVVGTPETQTPMLAGTIRYATLNPYWNVPVDLVRKRIAPKVLAGASLASLGYEALSGFTADAQVIDAKTIDWHGVADGTVEPRVRELPGRGNSMGTVKFMFPNDLGIYLHDTPQKELFAKADRHFSNGCVRLEDAPRLGRWLFDRTLKPAGTAPEQTVALPQGVPVYLMYFTASPADETIAYVADAYGRDGPALERFASR